MAGVEKYLSERYSDNPPVRDGLTSLYLEYNSWGLKDSTFDQDFVDGADDHFYPYIWEMILAKHLKNKGHDLSSKDEGPDFKSKLDGLTIWIEATCPSPAGIPEQWINPSEGFHTGSVPHEAMLLRWTSALKDKKEKLTGSVRFDQLTNSEIRKKGYLERGIVGPTDPYVIAISACRLGHGIDLLHRGISQFPFAVESALPVGPIEIVIDRETGTVIRQSSQHRPTIPKPNGAQVPTDNFLNPDYVSVSAILGTPAGVNAACGDQYPVVVVHNPLAKNKLPVGVLGADEEYVAEDKGDHYELLNILASSSG
ncbi:hypothetical protein M8997_009085 [Phyllobacterium sp. 21LDTY02-6]|uniref:hypothetical protein n=1 Tax=Phyllobacterium sp. 21LDTY02-6 TaxID=2944903 RepID=UPI002021A86F|nr:hypothetical protein [Phyllobacterium sp. 21LDTY02-6]MCO4317334.1 hypothetical protein [Phyllobacterium sp. 21LDTY02-6]